MKVLSREGNTLWPVVRNAWDGKALQTMVRNAPLRATGTHIGILGHITKEQLFRHITGTELANGFFNRFMLVAVQRSKKLPFGGALTDSDLDSVRRRVASAMRFAGEQSEPLRFDADAREKWIAVYDDPPTATPGSGCRDRARRGPTPSGSPCSTPCWTARRPSASSTSTPRWPSGTTPPSPRTGSSATRSATRPPTRSGMAKTAPQGVTRTQVSDLFSRNKKAREIDRALTALVEPGRQERGETRTGGAADRPSSGAPSAPRKPPEPARARAPQVSPGRPDGLANRAAASASRQQARRTHRYCRTNGAWTGSRLT
jgi:hypothetical protein